jgi:hypothetical protein
MISREHLPSRRRLSITSTLIGLGLIGSIPLMPVTGLAQSESVIVQGPDLARAKAAVLDVGGEVTHELAIIGAVGARLTPEQRDEIEADEALRVRSDRKVQTTPERRGD